MYERLSQNNWKNSTYPGPSRERSRIIVHVVGALKMAYGKHTRLVVESESPISNGLTTVAVLRMRI